MLRSLRASDVPAVLDLVVAAGLFTEDEAGFLVEVLTPLTGAGVDGDGTCLVDEREGVLAAVAYFRLGVGGGAEVVGVDAEGTQRLERRWPEVEAVPGRAGLAVALVDDDVVVNVMRGAEAVSSYAPIDESAKFRIEYWALEEPTWCSPGELKGASCCRRTVERRLPSPPTAQRGRQEDRWAGARCPERWEPVVPGTPARDWTSMA
ncbi:hypothetical protein [Geodermatophilus sp. SYSU D00710]